jgi:3'-phosphoadenosine 5'-phosphosulfate sulfotransferase (PAPS reductase)/FAD synthetase
VPSDLKHVVGFSGGADSQAALRVVRDMHGDENVIALNSNAGGNEHPITEAFIAKYSAEVFPVTTVAALIMDMGGRGTRPGRARDMRQKYAEDDELTFDRLAEIKGRFPSRKAQFCTEHLKLAPQARWCRENLTERGIDFVRYAGVRCDESDARKKTPESKWDEYFKCTVFFPIRCWTKLEVFAFLAHRGEDTNPLYKMGFGRVGCAPCINSGKDDVRMWAARFPEMIDKLREWERRVGRTFFAPCVPGMEINWVDDVVAWSKTTRGGKQSALPIVEIAAARGDCSSKYGLCE